MDEKLNHTNERPPGPWESNGVYWSLISGLLFYQVLFGNMDTLWLTAIAVVAIGVGGLIYLKR